MITFTGIKPTGEITLGNYIGSILNFDKTIKDTNKSFFCIVDLHAITASPDKPDILRENIKKSVALYIAMNLHEKTNIFIQSHVPQHSELSWILTCFSKNGELDRMTQYKDKRSEINDSSTGLYTYPILMAADILLYNTTHVPVGIDQKQHIELCNSIATRFNNFYNTDVFNLPKAVIDDNFKKIYSLTDPLKKMSKSEENPKSSISLLDSPKVIEKKIKSSVTDSIGIINYDYENQPGVTNLLNIYSALSHKSISDCLDYFKGQNYGFLKSEVSKIIINELSPIQERFNIIYNDDSIIKQVLDSGAQIASKDASLKIEAVKKIIGFY